MVSNKTRNLTFSFSSAFSVLDLSIPAVLLVSNKTGNLTFSFSSAFSEFDLSISAVLLEWICFDDYQN
jgi:hypothetical protein